MKKILMSVIATVFCATLIYAQNQDLVQYVNTLQGSYNTPEFSHGRCSPLVGLPQGGNYWSPSGFSIVNNTVRGVGGGGITFMPLTANPETLERNSSFSFDPEKITGQPHHFKITTDNGVTSEVSPTERCAVFQFSYPRRQPAFLVINGNSGGINIDAGKRTISSDSQNYFIMQFDQPFVNSGKIEGSGGRSDIYIEFKAGTKVQARVATSRISLEQAQTTFDRELGNKDFDEVKTEAHNAWNNLLNKIVVEGGTLEQRKTFYSCMFRANLRPSKNFEVDKNGKPHFNNNGEVHDGFFHSSPILWDAYRSQFALQNIINTQGQEEFVQSLMKIKPLTGWWPSGHVMIGNHAISVLADAWVKGVRTFDPETALKYYYHEVTHSKLDSINNKAYNIEHVRGYGRMGFEDYFAAGYIPYPQNTNRVMETTSKTIEYNYDDFCAYALAKMTGNKFYEDLFAKHIYNYKNLFDPADHFFKGRDIEGNFDTDFNPYEWGGAFVEGNGWQWKFSIQHDPQGLIDLIGGDKQFVKELDELFSVPSDSVLFGGYGFMIHEINEAVAGGQGQYAQGNEPCFHVIYLYNYAGEPWKAQSRLRESLTKLYNSGPKGFPGDEDGGAMSSWYVFSAMGFYTVTPGTDQYVIGSPLFDKITISLENGRKFTVVADNNGAENMFINSATLNGKPWTKNWFTHEVLMNGGELHFKMSNQPNKQRGTGEEDRPYSVSKDK